ncbi:hypothetical protein IFM89_010133 [Coptis chinensis]|uniref:F-box domain-containing protein n=1 Tax=Coptis chinensis TaxID=261450 RepID=A0A835M7M7_9MAGN|nr:hypothetical protein IFM89_010133 [Coptis chinensis]
MDRLPCEIVTDILSRLPIKPLVHSRCVCKTWCTIISDPSFQLNRAANTDPDLILHCKPLCQRNKIFFAEKNHQTIILKPKIIDVSLFDSMSLSYEINIMGSCNGLLCLSKRGNKRRNINIFNPITGEHQQLPHCTLPNNCKRITKYMSGFGYDVSMQQFKMVLLLFYRPFKSINVQKEVQVYTLGSKDWRRKIGNVPNLSFPNYYFPKYYVHVSFVFANGSLHWIAIDNTSSNPKSRIVSFHLGVEEFTVFPTPDSIGQNSDDPLKYWALGVLDDRLSLLDSSSRQYVDAWVTKDCDGKTSWNKLFSVRDPLVSHRLVRPIQVLKNGEILLTRAFPCLVAYNTNSKEFRLIEVPLGSFEPIPFVATLISVISAFGMNSDGEKLSCRKRKQPS